MPIVSSFYIAVLSGLNSLCLSGLSVKLVKYGELNELYMYCTVGVNVLMLSFIFTNAVIITGSLSACSKSIVYTFMFKIQPRRAVRLF